MLPPGLLRKIMIIVVEGPTLPPDFLSRLSMLICRLEHSGKEPSEMFFRKWIWSVSLPINRWRGLSSTQS
jgi:hypothetical protein